MGRSGNSCRLRWLNYLSPDIRRGEFTVQEILMILTLHHEFGNRWSRIVQQFPGRTDNDIKNFWNTRLKKEAKRLNCDVKSNEFRQMMTARLTESAQVSLTTPADPGLKRRALEYIPERWKVMFERIAVGTCKEV
ncbi:hypothetical protein ACS0TY_023293 [Phlomoides rotata]